jgi:hypothetical protein
LAGGLPEVWIGLAYGNGLRNQPAEAGVSKMSALPVSIFRFSSNTSHNK